MGWINPGIFIETHYASIDLQIGSSNSGGLFETYWFAKADFISGGIGNDTVYQGTDSDVIDGGQGIDTVIYQSPVSDYSADSSIIRVGNTVIMDGPEGRDHLRDVEAIEFSNFTMSTALIAENSAVFDVEDNTTQVPDAVGGTTFISTALDGILQWSLPSLDLDEDEVGNSSVWDILLNIADRITIFEDGNTQLAISTSHGEKRIDSSVKYLQIAEFEPIELAQAMAVLKADEAPDDGNNSSASAVSLGSGAITSFTSAKGSIESQGDVDHFKADLQSGQKYSFLLWANTIENSRLDPQLTIRAPNGSVWQNDNLTNSTTMSFITFVAPQTGTYAFEATGVGTSTGNYWLSITPLDLDPTADNLTPTSGDTDNGNSNWDWQGDSGDDNFPTPGWDGNKGDLDAANRLRGHNGEDTIEAGDGNDIIWGDDGEDRLYGEDGDDTIRGGSHNDRIVGGDDDDLIYGEDGNDRIWGDTSPITDNGDDTIYGGEGEDRIYGGRGDDYIKGEDDNDDINGNDGNDELYGDKGDDDVDGDDGDDQVFGGPGDDDLKGGEGRDRLAGEGDDDFLRGEEGDDALYGGDDDDVLRGGEGDDLLHGESGTDTADFSDGDDGVVVNLFKEISVSSDLGTDLLYSIENIIGSDGDDVIDGDHSNNELSGENDDDIIRGHNGNDIIHGDSGYDIVWGDEGDDYVYGDGGKDEVRGGLGDDHLFGGSSDDHLRGEQGDDTIDGGTGTDTVFFWGEHDDFSIVEGTSGEIIVTDLRTDGLEGRDVLTNVEYIEFFDGKALITDLLAAAPSADDDFVTVENDRPSLLDPLLNDATNATDAHYSDVKVVSGSGTASIIGGRIVYDPGSTSAARTTARQETVELSYSYTTSGFQTATAKITLTVGPDPSITASGGPVKETVVDGGTIGAAFSPVGDTAATLTMVDPSARQPVVYAIINDPSGLFEIADDAIKVKSGAVVDYETAKSHDVEISATDADGRVFAEVITIEVENYQGSGTGTSSPETIVGTSEEDNISGSGGADLITGGGGADVITGSLAEISGDTITDFSDDDKLVFKGSAFERDDLTVTSGSAILDIDDTGNGASDGQVTLQGDFSALEFMAVTSDGDTIVTAETALPSLKEGQSVDSSLVNGINNQEFLTGDGLTDFRVSLVDMGFAGYDNALGVYEIDESDNLIDTRFLFANVNADKTAQVTIGDVEAGNRLGFFIVQDAADKAALLEETDTFSFVNSFGDDADLADGSDIFLAVNGTAVEETVFHSFSDEMNSDELQHVLSGANAGGESITVGFEDLTGGGDRDYEDVVFIVETFDSVI
jgi:Ca2+-binding RTX toxin-like protein